MLSYAVTLFSNFISFLIVYITMKKIENRRLNTNVICYIAILIIAFINIELEYVEIIGFKLIIRIFIYYLINRLLCLASRTDGTINSLIYIVMTFIIELIVAIIINGTSFTNTYLFVRYPSYAKCFITIISTLVIYFVLKMKIMNRLINRTKEIIIGRKEYLKYIVIIIIFMLGTLTFYTYFANSKIIMSVALIFLASLSAFFYFLYKNNKLMNFNSYLMDINSSYESMLTEYKMFKHNLKHELCAIKNIGGKKVNNIIDEFFEEYKVDKDVNVNISSMPLPIKNIIHQSIIRTKSFNIVICSDNNIKSDFFDKLNEKTYLYICESLGILIDNALESTSDNYIYINIMESSNSITIECINKFDGKIDIDDFGINSYSTKQNHDGLGIVYLKQKNIFETNFKINNNKYIATLKLKK